MTKRNLNVAQYLIARMEQLGIKQMFGVAGNYTAPLLNIIHEGHHEINIIRNTNEQVAGFAADGYARLNGPSAVYVTYSVGAFSAINAIAGSYTEKVPVLIINGAPTNKEYSIERNAGLTYAHTTGDMVPDIEMYRNITVAAERITNAEQARYQIDSALTAMITYKRPVYLEITEDVWRKEFCEEIDLSQLTPLQSGKGVYITKSDMDEAIYEVFKNLNNHKQIIFWAGIELQRFNLTAEFDLMLQVINEARKLKKLEPIKFITTPMSKSVLSEEHEFFENNGCVTLNRKKVNEFLGDDGCLIGIGAWTIGKDNGNQNIRSQQTIIASHGGLWVGAKFFPLIDLREFLFHFTVGFLFKLFEAEIKVAEFIILSIKNLFKKVYGRNISTILEKSKKIESIAIEQNALLSLEPLVIGDEELLFKTNNDNVQCEEQEEMRLLTYDLFISTIKEFVKDKPVVVDAGFPLIAAQSLKITNQSHFIAQASWLSIGYSLGALTGVSEAYPTSRAVCIVGDGAFQETCQAISDQIALKQNNVIFVLVNGVYGIEQEIVDSTPFITQDEKQIHTYNILPKWDYVKLNESYGGKGIKVDTVRHLENALEEVRRNNSTHYLIEVHVPSTDVPQSIRLKHQGRPNNKSVGEDEYWDENWPPVGVY